jgi:hypothetical protein
MADKETEVVSSWTRILRNLFLFATGSVAGFFVVQADEWPLRLLGVCLLLGFPLWVIMVLWRGIGGRGPCPVCDNPIEIDFGTETAILCRHCGQYLEATKRKLRQMNLTQVTAEPTFAVPTPWPDLWSVIFRAPSFSTSTEDYLKDKLSDALMTKKEGPRLLVANWPPRCCVCGKAPTHAEVIQAAITFTPPARIRVRGHEATLIAKGIPHCAHHSHGVKFGNVLLGPPRPGSRFGLLFRSYSYRNDFWKLNPWQWPADLE